MKGLQLGILNWNDQGFLPVFPFFNFTLPGDHSSLSVQNYRTAEPHYHD